MTSYYSQCGSQLLERYRFISRSTNSSSSSSSSHSEELFPIDALSLIDMVLHINTCYTLFFWELRHLMKEASQLGNGSSSGCTIPVTIEKQCEKVQAAQDEFTRVLGHDVLGPALYACLMCFVDAEVEASSIRRDVLSLLGHGKSPYCVEESGEEEEEEEEMGDSNVADDCGNDDGRSGTPCRSSEARGHNAVQKRRWARARAAVCTAPPPASPVAPLVLSLAKALLSVHRRCSRVALPWLFTRSNCSGSHGYTLLAQRSVETMESLLRMVTYIRPSAPPEQKPFEDAAGLVLLQPDKGSTTHRAVAGGPPLARPRHSTLWDPFSTTAQQRPHHPIRHQRHQGKRMRGSVTDGTARRPVGIISSIPREVLQHIMAYVPPRYTRTLSLVSRAWHQAVCTSTTLRAYISSSRAMTRAYITFYREDWGEKTMRLPTLTTIHRLHVLRIAQVAEALEGIYSALSRDPHIAPQMRCQQQQQEQQHISLLRREGLPIDIFVDYILGHLPSTHQLHRALRHVLDGIAQETKWHDEGDDAKYAPCFSSRSLRQQYLMLELLTGTSVTSPVGKPPMKLKVLVLLFRHWPAVHAVYRRYTQNNNQE